MAPVLVVDDDQAIRETLRLLLEDEGYEVVEVEDGVGALQVLRASRRPMVVLLDLMMPRMNGHQVLTAVAADAHLLHTHIFIMLTASPQARLLTVGRLGDRMRVPCVEKPFDLDDLLDEVARAAARANQAAIQSQVEVAEAFEACN